jgi:hypothetical protein
VGGAVAVAAAIAGCAAAPAKQPVSRDPCARTSVPALPETQAECVAPADLPGGAPPSCVPAYARGAELERDDANHIAAYQACLPEGRSATRAPVRVDPRRVMIERIGERRASERELEVIVGRLSLDISTRDPALAAAPWIMDCREDRHGAGDRCLSMNLVAREADLPSVMKALAKWMPTEPICVAMKVEFGVPEGCPIVDRPQPVTQ